MEPDHAHKTKQAPGNGASFILEPKPANIARAAAILADGELVAIPTETVYGLAANAFDEAACRKIFTLKGRPLLDPLIVHAHDWSQLEYLAEVNTTAMRLAEKFWPGPLTLVLKKKSSVSDLVTAGLSTVAIRMPRHPIARQLLQQLPFPVAAPSANPFGYVSPTQANHVLESFGNRSPVILNGGNSEIGVESTILDISDPGRITLLRPGAISLDELRTVAGYIHLKTSHADSAPKAPGMLARHYSPNTKIVLFYQERDIPTLQDNDAIIFLTRPESTPEKTGHVFWFSESGNLKQIAQNLFALIRQLDCKNYNSIWIQQPANEGIGLAINDRLTRAASLM